MLVKREILCEELTYNCVCFDMLVLCNIMNMYQAMCIKAFVSWLVTKLTSCQENGVLVL